jgi:hypothetical protein
MKKAPLVLAALALATVSAEAKAGYDSVGRMTLNLRLTTAGPERQTFNGTQQSLSTSRFGNRELLQLLADRELIPSIQGYSLVEFFDYEGDHDGYGAYNSSTGHRVWIPFDILESLDIIEVAAVSTNERFGSTTVKIKAQQSATLEDSALSIFKTITLTSATGKVNGENEPYMAASSTGTLHGSNDDRGFVVEGTLNVSRSTIYAPLPE